MIGVVLAGGFSRRLGIDKLFYSLKGKPLVLYPICQLTKVRSVSRVVVIASPYNAERFVELGLETIVDNMLIGPLGAIYIALRRFRECLVLGGDMPFITSETLEKLVELCSPNYDVCVPKWSTGYIEPLCAIYRNTVLPLLEQAISMNMLAIHRLLNKLRTLFIPIEQISRDPIKEFTNINTAEDLEKLRKATEYA